MREKVLMHFGIDRGREEVAASVECFYERSESINLHIFYCENVKAHIVPDMACFPTCFFFKFYRRCFIVADNIKFFPP